MLTGKLAEALAGEMVPKFIATADRAGNPNVVVLTNMEAVDDKTIIFGELMLWKTRANLDVNPKVTLAVMTEAMDLWRMRATFKEWVEVGPYVDRMNQRKLFRYNAYMGIRRVGVLEVQEVTGSWHPSTPAIAKELLGTKLARAFVARGQPGEVMPVQVKEKFSRSKAFKVLSFLGPDGWPTLVPSFSLFPVSSSRLIFGRSMFAEPLAPLAEGARVAANVLTPEPISYQVKGNCTRLARNLGGRYGIIDLTECYTACPPVPGERIDPAGRANG